MMRRWSRSISPDDSGTPFVAELGRPGAVAPEGTRSRSWDICDVNCFLYAFIYTHYIYNVDIILSLVIYAWLWQTIVFYIIVYHIVVYYMISLFLHYIKLYHIILYHIIFHYIILYHIILYHIISNYYIYFIILYNVLLWHISYYIVLYLYIIA